jgi:hypothetical protein
MGGNKRETEPPRIGTLMRCYLTVLGTHSIEKFSFGQSRMVHSGSRVALCLFAVLGLLALSGADESIVNTPLGTVQGVVFPTYRAFYVRARRACNGPRRSFFLFSVSVLRRRKVFGTFRAFPEYFLV